MYKKKTKSESNEELKASIISLERTSFDLNNLNEKFTFLFCNSNHYNHWVYLEVYEEVAVVQHDRMSATHKFKLLIAFRQTIVGLRIFSFLK